MRRCDWVAASLTARELATELAESTERMSSLVGAVKRYAYMDRGELVEVDVHEGLETTLTILGHKLKHTTIEVVRDYDRTLPQLTVRGAELNQVWTNLLDNAIDALGDDRDDHDHHAPRRRLRRGRHRRRRPGHPAGGRASASSTRSSPPRRSATAPASGSTPHGGSSTSATAAALTFDSEPGADGLPRLAAARGDRAMTSAPTVTDVPDRDRFEIAIDGATAGFVQYHRSPGTIAFIHTEIDPSHEGEGLGGVLVRAVLDGARAEGLAVLPFCPFVRGFIERHDEYLDLVPVTRRAQFGLGDG